MCVPSPAPIHLHFGRIQINQQVSGNVYIVISGQCGFGEREIFHNSHENYIGKGFVGWGVSKGLIKTPNEWFSRNLYKIRIPLFKRFLT